MKVGLVSLVHLVFKLVAMSDFMPAHPGKVLAEDFLEPLAMDGCALAKALGLPQTWIGEIIDGQRAVTSEIATRLARHFDTSTEFWIGMQMSYDLEMARLT